MKKLHDILVKLTEGQKVRGFNLSLCDIEELIRLYNTKARKEHTTFINGNCKAVLEKCSIKTKVNGIGWDV